MLVFRVCGARQNFHVLSLYRNPYLHDRIYECLLTAMAAVKVVYAHALLLFMGDLNIHHQEGLGSTTTNCQSVAALAIVSHYNQLVIGLTHACGGTLMFLTQNQWRLQHH